MTQRCVVPSSSAGRLPASTTSGRLPSAAQGSPASKVRGAACWTESRRDFAHKMQICLKELRETSVWLRMADRIGLEGAGVLIGECNELLSIFVSSIKTVKASLRRL